jgi:hypothetical protein
MNSIKCSRIIFRIDFHLTKVNIFIFLITAYETTHRIRFTNQLIHQRSSQFETTHSGRYQDKSKLNCNC